MSDLSKQPPGKSNFVLRNNAGDPFSFRLIFAGDIYGNGATWENPYKIGLQVNDAEYAGNKRFHPEGQQIGCWNLKTFLNHAPFTGWNLMGGVQKWYLDGMTVEVLRNKIIEAMKLAMSVTLPDDQVAHNAAQRLASMNLGTIDAAGGMVDFIEANKQIVQPYLWLNDGSEVTVCDDGEWNGTLGAVKSFDPRKCCYQIAFGEDGHTTDYFIDQVQYDLEGGLTDESWDSIGNLVQPIYSPTFGSYGTPGVLPLTKRDFILIAKGNMAHARELYAMCIASDASPHPATIWDEIGGNSFFQEDITEEALAKALEQHFSERGGHPTYLHQDWKYEVANGDTRRGYWEWVASSVNRDAHDNYQPVSPGMKG